MSEAGLQADNLTFAYPGGPAVLDGATVRLPAGSLTGIIGPNGSGKTTLLRAMAGLLEPQAGSVSLGGQPLRSLPRAIVARRMALVPQETQLAFEYTVLEMATMGRYPHLGRFEIEGPGDLAIARDALRATGTLHLEERYFNTLSGGEKQRVVIAGALAQAPDILLLDEPTASLDLAYQLEIRTLLRKLHDERGLTIVISTHDLNMAAALCRDLVLLDRGRILASGPTHDILSTSLIRALYGVDVEIAHNASAGHLTVVPVRLANEGRP
jgi:iron complex transport system ATP-binding protein